jgi:hypothetical protein
VIAYKFLGERRVGPFTGFVWPEHEWVVAGVAQPCRVGVHACRVEHLPLWLGPELWEVELDGEIVEQERKLVAERGRLVRRVTDWDDESAAAFGEYCATRIRGLVGFLPILSGFVADVDRFVSQGRVAMAGFAVARAAERRDGRHAYDRERRRQAEWLGRRLGLGV